MKPLLDNQVPMNENGNEKFLIPHEGVPQLPQLKYLKFVSCSDNIRSSQDTLDFGLFVH